jgi:hypothetical protein
MDARNLPFTLESRLFRVWFRTTGLRPSSAPFVSGDSFRAIADHRVEPGSHLAPHRLRTGDVVFVQSSELKRFSSTILPKVKKRFVLITHNGDVNIDNSFAATASNPFIVRWFAQNATIRHPKVSGIPIGLENRNLHYNGVVRDFERLARSRPVQAMRILSAFSVQTNTAERGLAKEVLEGCGLVHCPPRTNSRAYRKTLVRYGFVASPPGNGVDCHRTWEALYLGVIPIVRRSPFYDSFPGLPVAFVDDWKEIASWTPQYLECLFADLSPKISETPYLRFSYWADLVKTVQKTLWS